MGKEDRGERGNRDKKERGATAIHLFVFVSHFSCALMVVIILDPNPREAIPDYPPEIGPSHSITHHQLKQSRRGHGNTEKYKPTC